MQFPILSIFVLTGLSFVAASQALAQEISSCTSTITTAFTCPSGPIPEFETTVTETSTVDCGGCGNVTAVVSKLSDHPCPLEIISLDTLTITATTYTCSPTPTIAGALPPRAAAIYPVTTPTAYRLSPPQHRVGR